MIDCTCIVFPCMQTVCMYCAREVYGIFYAIMMKLNAQRNIILCMVLNVA